MTEDQWQVGFAKAIGIFLNGEEIVTPGKRGERIIDDSFYILFNAHHEMLEFYLPSGLNQHEWGVEIDTTRSRFVNMGQRYTENKPIPVADRSVTVLRKRDMLPGLFQEKLLDPLESSSES